MSASSELSARLAASAAIAEGAFAGTASGSGIMPASEQLPPFRVVPLDFGLWQRHLARAEAQSIRVLKEKSVAPGKWLVRVSGSSGNAYTVRVRPQSSAGAWECSCSCPAGEEGRYWCKHAAVALEQLNLLPDRTSRIWAEVEALLVSGQQPF